LFGSQILVRGLKCVAQFYASKYSKLISICCWPYLVTRSLIQNGHLVTKETYHKNTNFIKVLDELSLFYDYYVLFNYLVSFGSIKSKIYSRKTFWWKKWIIRSMEQKKCMAATSFKLWVCVGSTLSYRLSTWI